MVDVMRMPMRQPNFSVLRSLPTQTAVVRTLASSSSKLEPSSVHLRLTVLDAQFKKSGRYFITFNTAEAERRTDVCDSSSSPHFKQAAHTFPLHGDLDVALASLEVRLTATQLAFSRGATQVGVCRLSLPGGTTVNGAGEECVLTLTSPKGGAAVVGTVTLAWRVEDPHAAQREEAERAAAQREAVEAARAVAARAAEERTAAQRAADLLAAAQRDAAAGAARAAEAEALREMERQTEEAAQRAASLRMAALSVERAAEEKLAWAAAWGLPETTADAAQAVRDDRVAADKAREEEAMEKMAAEEARRVAAEAKREEKERMAVMRRLMAEEEERHVWANQWEAVLDSMIILHRGDGWRVELTGRQLVGLSDAASQTKRGVVAFMQGGRRVVLSAAVAAALRKRLEGRMHERSLEADLVIELPATYRAATASGAATPREPVGHEQQHAGGEAQQQPRGELTSWERGGTPRPSASAPPRDFAIADRPLSQQWRGVFANAGLVRPRGGSAKVAPIDE